jgi:hypothetical protein
MGFIGARHHLLHFLLALIAPLIFFPLRSFIFQIFLFISFTLAIFLVFTAPIFSF